MIELVEIETRWPAVIGKLCGSDIAVRGCSMLLLLLLRWAVLRSRGLWKSGSCKSNCCRGCRQASRHLAPFTLNPCLQYIPTMLLYAMPLQ